MAQPRAGERPNRAESGPPETRLRLVTIHVWPLATTVFFVSTVVGIVSVAVVALTWGILDMAGVWDAINNRIRDSTGGRSLFDVKDILGMSRVVSLACIVAVVAVTLATTTVVLGALAHNVASSLLGGVELRMRARRSSRKD